MAQGVAGLRLMVVKQHWRKGFAHVPLHVVGQQAHKHMGSDPIGEPVQDGSQLQINGLIPLKYPLISRACLGCSDAFLAAIVG